MLATLFFYLPIIRVYVVASWPLLTPILPFICALVCVCFSPLWNPAILATLPPPPASPDVPAERRHALFPERRDSVLLRGLQQLQRVVPVQGAALRVDELQQGLHHVGAEVADLNLALLQVWRRKEEEEGGRI